MQHVNHTTTSLCPSFYKYTSLHHLSSHCFKSSLNLVMEPNANHNQLHIFFIPFLAKGHIIPLIDTARLFAERGVRATVVTTPGNASMIHPTVDKTTEAGHSMQLLLIPYPSAEAGLPPGCENTASLPHEDGAFFQLYRGIQLLQQPFEQLLREHRPDCIMSDAILLFPPHVAASFGIPNLQFNVSPPFSISLIENIMSNGTHLVPGDTVGPTVGLPHEFELARAELPKILSHPKLSDLTAEAEKKSLGVLYNSFYELDPEYVDQCKLGGKRKVWCVGPVRMYEILNAEKDAGSQPNSDKWEEIQRWLDSKDASSVLYISFGSESSFPNDQLREMALGLEASGYPFVWVVREGGGAETITEWLPDGFEKRVAGKQGLILTEWAPQILILTHPSVGGFMMHCGWNSSIETVSVGLPVIAWPLHSEQFFNERLVVEVLRIGVRMFEGAKRTLAAEERGIVKGEAIKEAVQLLLGGGEEAVAMRGRAKECKKLARAAMEKGGSSYENISFLIEELTRLAEERRRGEGKVQVAENGTRIASNNEQVAVFGELAVNQKE